MVSTNWSTAVGSAQTSFLPTATTLSSATLTPPAPSTYASGASPKALRATSATVAFLCQVSLAVARTPYRPTGPLGSDFFTSTQSLNTALEPAAPEEKVLIFRTGNTGTRPRRSAARERTCTTPVEPKRNSTMSCKFSRRLYHVECQPVSRVALCEMYVFNFSSSSFKPPPSGSPSSVRSSRV